MKLRKLLGAYKNLTWDEIKYIVKDKISAITYPFRKTFDFVVKIIQYSPVLWHNYDWDYVYFLYLMKYKLSRMRKRILKNNLVEKAETIAKEMKYVEDLIDKYIDDDFCTEEREQHREKWGEIKIEHTPIDVDGKTYYEINFSSEKATTKKLQKQEREEYANIEERADKEKSKTLTKIFSYTRKHIERWWD